MEIPAVPMSDQEAESGRAEENFTRSGAARDRKEGGFSVTLSGTL